MTFESLNAKEVQYRCTACNAEDKLKLLPDEHIPEAVQCWNCGAGRGTKSTMEMYHTGRAMFVVVQETPENEVQNVN